MKKYLLGTSALVAAGLVTGQANAADKLTVGVGGFMEQWFAYSQNESETSAHYDHWGQNSDTEVHIKGSVNLDNGLKVTVRIEFEANSDAQNVSIDEEWLQISSDSLGLLDIGADDIVTDINQAAYPKVGVGLTDAKIWLQNANMTTSGTDPINAITTGGSADIAKISYWTPADWQKLTGLQASGSFQPKLTNNNSENKNAVETTSQNAYALNLTYSRNIMDVDVYTGYGYYHENDDMQGVSASNPATGYHGHTVWGQFKYGPWILGGGYNRTQDKLSGKFTAANLAGANTAQAALASTDGYGYNVGLAYTMGRWQFGLAYAYVNMEGLLSDPDHDKTSTTELAAKYDFGVGFDWRTSLLYRVQDEETNQGLSKTAATDANEMHSGWAIVTGFTATF